MKVKYTPGTPDGLVGKTYTVEVVGINIGKAPFINKPVIKSVRIKYEDGKSEWIDGMKFFDDIRDTRIINRLVY